MRIDRRDFFKKTAISGVGISLGVSSCSVSKSTESDSFSHLKSMGRGIKPIKDDERRKRIEKAQRLMRENKIDALYLDAGTSMFYFTGMRWWQSERMTAVIIPSKGDPAVVCPKFEEGRVHEIFRFGNDVRTWEEHESPYLRVSQLLKDWGTPHGRMAMEERVRFFLFDGIRKAASHLDYVSGDPITLECRVIKSDNEIALMQRANDITIEAYKAVIPLLKAGMTRNEFRSLTQQAHSALGASGGIGAQFGIASSSPHGMADPPPLQEGDIVLMDGGCNVDGYRSDISRTIVFGEPTKRQREMWNLMSKAKAAAFEKAGLGIPCEDVDAAARQVYVDYGFGPDYKVPGLPHRTGHGIGLDGHEWINLVRGNKRPMEVGMCFTNEPMVVLPGEFGVRLEDAFYITEDGPVYFTKPSPALDVPFG